MTDKKSVPVWLCDIDGVLNAVTSKPDSNVWPRDTWRTDVVAGFRLHVAQPVIDFVCHVHDIGAAEVRWHTTWQNSAHEFAKAFGFPELSVQHAPEAENFDSPTWWKKPAVFRVLYGENRRLIWTDDEIKWMLHENYITSNFNNEGALIISPTERVGLTKKHVKRISEYLGITYDI